jgi:GAG-pre-integrase domain
VNSALSSFLESSGVVGRSVEDLLLLHHRRLGHPSFSALSRLYPPLFEKRLIKKNWFVMRVSLGNTLGARILVLGV